MRKKGFTLLEVVLFLALSGVLILIVVSGTSYSIAEKRFNDTVNSFVSYLQDLYASVNYTRHSNNGQSSQAVYGKLVNMETKNKKTTFSSYTILGSANIRNLNGNDVLEMLTALSPEILDDDDIEEYRPVWGGEIKSTHQDPSTGLYIEDISDGTETISQIMLLLIRHPKNGMTFTYVYYPSAKETIPTNPNELYNPDISENSLLEKFISQNSSGDQDANFCVDSDDRWAGGGERRLVKIHKKANNASGVELISNLEKGGFCEE